MSNSILIDEIRTLEAIAQRDGLREAARWLGRRRAALEANRPAICDGCGIEFVGLRRPRADRANYCPTCREGRAGQRAAEQRYRAKRTIRNLMGYTPSHE